jgi:hypothetical protein
MLKTLKIDYDHSLFPTKLELELKEVNQREQACVKTSESSLQSDENCRIA